MSKVLDETIANVSIGQKIPIADKQDPLYKTYNLTIKDTTQVFVCPSCGHQVGQSYVDDISCCEDCCEHYDEKTFVKFD